MKPGDKAPDFTAQAVGKRTIILSELLAQSGVVLHFFCGAFTPICSVQTLEFQKILKELKALPVGCSTDSIWSLQVFSAALGGITYPLISDQKRDISSSYGVLNEKGYASRSVFIINREGKIVSSYLYKDDEMPDFDKIKKDACEL